MFTIDDIHSLLLELGLLTVESLLNGDYEATSINRRNRNLTVTTESQGDFFIKQVDGARSMPTHSLLNEIRFYDFAERHRGSLAARLPALVKANLSPGYLILRYEKAALPLWRYYKNQPEVKEIPASTLRLIGELLGNLHQELRDPALQRLPELAFLKSDLPFAFKLLQPHPGMLAHARSGAINCIARLQQEPGAFELWSAAARQWRVATVIHGDVKLDNFLVFASAQAGTVERIQLIDWEMAQFGDPAWDVAGVLNDAVFWWVITMPDDMSPEEMVRHARFPLTRIREGIAEFWRAYASPLRLAAHEQCRLAGRSVSYAGVRMVQTAYEISSRFETVPPIAKLLLNLGISVLRDPAKAADQLYGLPLLTAAADTPEATTHA